MEPDVDIEAGMCYSWLYDVITFRTRVRFRVLVAKFATVPTKCFRILLEGRLKNTCYDMNRSSID
jgi:hypothetical protein